MRTMNLAEQIAKHALSYPGRGTRRYVTFLLLLVPLAAPATAQETTDPILVCSELAKPDARLACFDNEAQKRRAAARAKASAPAESAVSAAQMAPAKNIAATPAVAPPTSTKPADDTIGLDGKQLSARRKAEGIEAQVAQPILAAVEHLTMTPGHQYYFALDNGQLWESTDTVASLFLSPREQVRIRPGALGSFFLKTKEGLSIRVHRLR